MKQPAKPSAECLTPILYVRNFREATRYYTKKLFFDLLWDWGKPASFGCVRLGKAEIFLCLKGQGQPGKQMTVGEMLEETLLHTFEEVPGGGVTSPHSASTHRHIQSLKKLHGIDYDTHASYRFAEKAGRAREKK